MLLIVTTAMLGAAWHNLQWNYFESHNAYRYASEETNPACVTAVVLTAPELLPAPPTTPLRAIPGSQRCRVAVQVRRIRDGTQWLAADGRCQLLVNGNLLAVEPGDQVQIFAQLRRPAPPMNPGEFDFAASARADRRLASLATRSPECVTVLTPSRHWSPGRVVDALREYGKRTLRTYVGPRQSGLAAAVLLGVREELPYEATMPFFLTGTVHLLVVSGLNVAILATGLYSLVWIGWLPRRVRSVYVARYRIAWLPGDGIGKEVLEAARIVLDRLGVDAEYVAGRYRLGLLAPGGRRVSAAHDRTA